MEATGANMVSGECIGDVSTVVGCRRAESKHHHPKGSPCMCIFAQAFHSAPLSHALRQQNFPATIMLLSRDLPLWCHCHWPGHVARTCGHHKR